MVRKWFGVTLVLIFALVLSGCQTARKQRELEMQGLRNQVTLLESQLQSKDEEISSLRDSLERSSQETEKVKTVRKTVKKKKVVHEVKSRPNIKQIQIALKNAGFDPGVIDGRMGRQTKEAIKEFQRAHNLSADGKVGKRTWAQLRSFLYQTQDQNLK